MDNKLYRPYIVLTGITLLCAFLLYRIIPEVFFAAQTAWPEMKDTLPAGIAMAHKLRLGLFLVPAACGLFGTTSKFIKMFQSPTVIVIFSCFAFIVFMLYTLMLCTPIILHGASLQ